MIAYVKEYMWVRWNGFSVILLQVGINDDSCSKDLCNNHIKYDIKDRLIFFFLSILYTEFVDLNLVEVLEQNSSKQR